MGGGAFGNAESLMDETSKTEKAAQQSQQAAQQRQGEATQAISLRTGENSQISYRNFNIEQQNQDYTDNINFLNNKNNRFSENTTEGRIANKTMDVLEKLLKEERTKENAMEISRNILILRNLNTKNFSDKDKKLYDSLMEQTENIHNKILKEHLGVNNTATNDLFTKAAMNQILNKISISNKEKEEEYEKTANDIYKLMESMKEYLNNPTGTVQIHKDNEIKKSAESLCTLYFAEAQMDHYNVPENPNNKEKAEENKEKYEQARDFYLNVVNPMEVTRKNNKGETETITGEDFLKENNVSINGSNRSMNGSEYTRLMYSSASYA